MWGGSALSEVEEPRSKAIFITKWDMAAFAGIISTANIHDSMESFCYVE
jgi:hypothetical protein